MQANSYSKYVLKDLHQSIDLFDRKIVYCQTYEQFDSAEARDAALQKLSTRRSALVKTALALSALGVECDPPFLPRSFVQSAEAAAGETVPAKTGRGNGPRQRAARR